MGARGWPHPLGLQHPEGIHTPPRAPSPWRHHRAQHEEARREVQLRQDDLPQVLRPPEPAREELPQEEVRPHHAPSPEEEDQGINPRRQPSVEPSLAFSTCPHLLLIPPKKIQKILK